MKRTAAVFFILVTLLSCDSRGKYHIAGECKGASDGDIVTLSYSNDGRHLHEIDKCEIRDGKFFFDGHVKDCKLCYIGNESRQAPQYIMFFLEEGNMAVEFSGTDGVVTGTRSNNLYKAATDSMEHFMECLDRIEEKMAHSNDNAVKDSLSLAGYDLQCRITEFIYNTVNENIENLFGLYMLVVYNEFFDADELKELIKRIPESSIDRRNNSLYDLIVEIESIRSRPASFEEMLFDI